MTWENGEKYIGKWKDGLMHGKGTYVWANGSRYAGKWEKGKMLEYFKKKKRKK